MLNTYYHAKEDVEKAYSMIDNPSVDKDTYASILIFCNFDKNLADKFYVRLEEKGELFLSDIVPWGSNELGWVLPNKLKQMALKSRELPRL